MTATASTRSHARNGGRAHDPDPESVEPSIGEATAQAWSSLRVLYHCIDRTLHAQTAAAPYLPLAVAASVGFVLGGGIASPLGRVLTRLAAQSFAPAMLDALLRDEAGQRATQPKGSD